MEFHTYKQMRKSARDALYGTWFGLQCPLFDVWLVFIQPKCAMTRSVMALLNSIHLGTDSLLGYLIAAAQISHREFLCRPTTNRR